MALVSMAGLDLSFMADSPLSWETAPKPKRKRRASKRSSLPCPTVMTDIKEFTSPIDGEVISSRSKLKAHERRHNVRQAGDFKPGEIVERENKRVAQSREQAQGVTSEWI